MKCRICGARDCREHCRCFSQLVIGHREWCPAHDAVSLADTQMPVRPADARACEGGW